MNKHFSKASTRLIISHSHRFSTISNLPVAPAPTSLETQSISSDAPPSKKKRGSTTLWFLGGLATYGLADWEKFKQREKTMNQLAYRQLCLEMEPMELNNIKKNANRLGFRRVVCKGVFDEQRSVYVGPKPKSMSKGSENGFYIITPLLPLPNDPTSIKSPILVNRGWVPSDWKEKPLEIREAGVIAAAAANESRKANNSLSSQQNPLSKFLYKFTKEQVSKVTHVEVIGMVRQSEIPGIFVLPNDPSSGKWFFVEVPALAQAMGFGEDTIYIEMTNKNMDDNRPYPVPRDDENLIRSKDVPLDNYFYSFLWYCLSVACFSKSSTSFMRRYS